MSYVSHPSYKTGCGCGCKPNYNPCCNCGSCNSCCDCNDNSQVITTVHRKTVINNYSHPHMPVGYHDHHVECCGASHVSNCGPNPVCSARCLDPTLYCLKTIVNGANETDQVIINAGLVGTFLAEVNQQLFEVQPENVLTIVNNALNIDGVAQTVSNLYVDEVRFVEDSKCCKEIDLNGTIVKLYVVNKVDTSCGCGG